MEKSPRKCHGTLLVIFSEKIAFDVITSYFDSIDDMTVIEQSDQSALVAVYSDRIEELAEELRRDVSNIVDVTVRLNNEDSSFLDNFEVFNVDELLPPILEDPFI